MVREAVIVMSSAYVEICTPFGRRVISEMLILNNVGDKIPPCDTPEIDLFEF